MPTYAPFYPSKTSPFIGGLTSLQCPRDSGLGRMVNAECLLASLGPDVSFGYITTLAPRRRLSHRASTNGNDEQETKPVRKSDAKVHWHIVQFKCRRCYPNRYWLQATQSGRQRPSVKLAGCILYRCSTGIQYTSHLGHTYYCTTNFNSESPKKHNQLVSVQLAGSNAHCRFVGVIGCGNGPRS